MVAAAVLLAGCGGGDEEAAWEHAPPLGHGRAAHAVVSDGTDSWALGGTDASGAPVLEVERLEGDSWRDVATLPGGGLNAPAAVFLDGRIYLIGGFGTTTNDATAAVNVYDVAAGTWSEAAPLPEPRGGHAAAVVDGKIHVVGGGNSVSTLDLHSVYDPASDSWSEASPLPRAKGSPAAVVHEGKLWVIGGRSGSDDFGDVDVYDSAADMWTHGPAIPPRGTHGAVVRDGAVLVVGGESQARGQALAEVLRLEDGDWRRATPLPAPRAFARTVVVGGAVLVVGGSAEAGSSHASQGSDTVFRLEAP
jgi:N-acetylneuraminic acid mutarotase